MFLGLTLQKNSNKLQTNWELCM